MHLLKIVSIISFSTIANLLSGFLKGKIMAVYFGSSGLGIWSQATNLFMICSIISLFGLNQGLIKEIAERTKKKVSDNFIYDTLSKSLFFSICNGIIIASAVIFTADKVSAFFFNNNLDSGIIIFLAVFLPFQVIGDVFGVFLLANKEIKRFTLANILISVFGLITFVIFAIFFKLNGAYLSVGIYGAITFASFYFMAKPLIKTGFIGLLAFHKQTGYGEFFKNTLTFGTLRLIQVVINPINMLLIRSLIIRKIGLAENGFFDALTRISIFYTPFITNILWSYTFPIYCGIKDNQQLNYEINKFVRLSLILFVPICIAIMIFGNFFTILLFSKGFIPIVSLFILWFVVDLLRVTAWPLNIVLIAKDRMKLAVSLEFFWNATFLVSAYLLIGRYSLKGIVISYIFSFALFLLINYLIMNKGYAFHFNIKTFLAFCISLALILSCGRYPRSSFDYIMISLLTLAFFIMVLDKQERLLMRDAVKRALVWNY